MGLLTGDGSALRAKAREEDARFTQRIDSLLSLTKAEMGQSIGAMDMEIEQARKAQDFRDPLIEAALQQGLASQVQAGQEKANQAAGTAGAERRDLGLTQLGAYTQGFLQAEGARRQRYDANAQAIRELLVAQGQIRTEGTKTMVGAATQLESQRSQIVSQLEAQAKAMDRQPSALAGIAAGVASAWMGGAGGALLAGLFSETDKKAKQEGKLGTMLAGVGDTFSEVGGGIGKALQPLTDMLKFKVDAPTKDAPADLGSDPSEPSGVPPMFQTLVKMGLVDPSMFGEY